MGPRVLHSTAWYLPGSVGGTEIYIHGLVSALASIGVFSTIAAVRGPGMAASYVHDGVTVESYPAAHAAVAPGPNAKNCGIVGGQFRALLARHKGAIYHQHSWTTGCGLRHLEVAREIGMPTVLTVHVPGFLCLRSTMLRFGKKVCVGAVSPRICGACWAQSKGLPRPFALLIGSLPGAIADLAGQYKGPVATAMRARAHGVEKFKEIRAAAQIADRIVVVCRWLYDALVQAGVPSSKLMLCRQGVAPADLDMISRATKSSRVPSQAFRFMFLGRCAPEKGIDVIIRAFRNVPRTIPTELAIFTPSENPDFQVYEQWVRSLAGKDDRVRFMGPLGRAQLAQALCAHDVLVVPSRWLETGPLVVLEAQAAGCYILGSDRGGVVELVAGTEAQQLLSPDDINAWTNAMTMLVKQHHAGNWERVPRSVRSMDLVAAEMRELYEFLR